MGKLKIPEVLAPAGSYESLVAAVNAGADAVYIGGQKFGARAYADNPLEDELLKGIEYAHHFGVKVYMTVNTLLKEKEMKELFSYILPYYEAGLDAIIVQDLGVFDFIRKHFPNIDIHASTQMSIMGYEAVKKLEELGITRVVPARELSLEEIRLIRDNTNVEIECFVYGALCYSYSGQCLMSSLIGGRSANRGRCAQPCRLPYNVYKDNSKTATKTTVLSCKDLCSLDILPDILEAGVDSLKIEGRMKSPRYTAGVVRIWKKYVNLYLSKGREKYRVDSSDRKELLELFDRGGQTEGYYNKHNGKDMLLLKEKPEREVNEKLFTFLDNTYVNTLRKIKVTGSINIYTDKCMELSLSTDDFSVCVYGEMPQKAVNKAVSQDDIKKQILKTGNTLYEFTDLKIALDEGLFIPVKQLNDLRRNAINALDEKILSPYKRILDTNIRHEIKKTVKVPKADNKLSLSVFCETYNQLIATKKVCADNLLVIKEISFEADTIKPEFWKKEVEKLKAINVKANLYMPHIFRMESREFFEKNKEYFLNADFDNVVIRSIEESEYISRIFKEAGIKRPKFIFDYNLYNYNNNASNMLKELGADRLTVPVELNLNELKEIDCSEMEVVVYGRLPMMITAQCIKKTTTGCDHKSETIFIKDRRSESMPVKNRCDFCYNSIYNAKPISTLGIAKEIKNIGAKSIRLMFTTENEKETEDIIEKYIKCYIHGQKVSEDMTLFTRGHFKRGIE